EPLDEVVDGDVRGRRGDHPLAAPDRLDDDFDERRRLPGARRPGDHGEVGRGHRERHGVALRWIEPRVEILERRWVRDRVELRLHRAEEHLAQAIGWTAAVSAELRKRLVEPAIGDVVRDSIDAKEAVTGRLGIAVHRDRDLFARHAPKDAGDRHRWLASVIAHRPHDDDVARSDPSGIDRAPARRLESPHQPSAEPGSGLDELERTDDEPAPLELLDGKARPHRAVLLDLGVALELEEPPVLLREGLDLALDVHEGALESQSRTFAPSMRSGARRWAPARTSRLSLSAFMW